MGPIKPTTDCSLTEGTTIASTKTNFVDADVIITELTILKVEFLLLKSPILIFVYPSASNFHILF
jgi:hypothetical protein